MSHSTILVISVVLALTSPVAIAADPLAGNWMLQHQEAGGNQTDANPLTLRITASGERLDFAYIVTVNNAPIVNLKFNSPLDGTAAEVSGGDGKKVGTAKVSRDGAAYKILIEGAGRPSVTTQLTL